MNQGAWPGFEVTTRSQQPDQARGAAKPEVDASSKRKEPEEAQL